VKWLSTLLGRQGPTAKHPFVITEPTIGFLNLAGQDAAGIAERDRAAFAAMFAHHVVSVGDVPQCDVLFLYCRLDEHGVIPGQHLTVGQVIAAARAYVAVIALDNPPERYQKMEYASAGWNSNLVMVLDRNGESFNRFWQRLFKAMFAGESMLMAWVANAPQFEGAQGDDKPASIMSANAGHVTFATPSP
jgi:hypothetical protein